MTSIQIAAVIVSLTAVAAYVNARFVRLPPGIGLMATALAMSIAVVALDAGGVIDAAGLERVVARADFGHTLLDGMLGLLLFAGALQLDARDLLAEAWIVTVLSLGGTILSTLLVGGGIYLVLEALGRGIGLYDALLFGALISPTDPVAVLSVLKTSRVPREVAVQISGESLFNDGVGVVVFFVVLALATGDHVSAGGVAWLFVKIAFGGVAFGLAMGAAGRLLLRGIEDFTVEVLVTLALVLGGYATAEALGVSAPIAAVVAGLVVGVKTRREAEARRHLLEFWELVDNVLNAVLFLMLGLEGTRLVVSAPLAVAAAIAVPLVLAARLCSVTASVLLVRPFSGPISRHAIAILTWGGLRGGLAVALALALPAGTQRDTLLTMTYAVVCFAILVQGLTLPRLLRALGLSGTSGSA